MSTGNRDQSLRMPQNSQRQTEWIDVHDTEKGQRVTATCEAFTDQMSEQDRGDLYEFCAAGEWALAIEMLLAVLHRDQLVVSATQETALTSLATDISIPMPALNTTA